MGRRQMVRFQAPDQVDRSNPVASVAELGAPGGMQIGQGRVDLVATEHDAHLRQPGDHVEAEEGERPDTIAQKAYGNPFYDWIILLTNNMVNAKYDWPMSNYEIYKVLESEYEDPYGTIHHYEMDEIGPYQAGQRVDETFYNGTHKLNIDGSIVTKNGNEICRPVTIAEWFTDENEKKREIYLLKPNYLQPFVDDFRKQNKYKKSGNYINQRLKATG